MQGARNRCGARRRRSAGLLWLAGLIAALSPVAPVVAAAPTERASSEVAQPGHYIVVRLGADGVPEPVFHARVALDGARETPGPAALALARANPDQLVVRADGWNSVVEVPRFVRGEFAANNIDGPIESRIAPDPERAFVVRIPGDVEGVISLSSMGRETRIDLEALEAAAASLPLADRAGQGATGATPAAADGLTARSADGAQSAGPSSNRVDVLVMGDGYTSAEAAKFATDVENMRVAMFGFSPYREYAALVNWTSQFTPSAQSGADHPPYQAGCTSTSCCAETAAQSDPRANTFVDTAFDGRFCTNQIHRLVTVNRGKVLAEASASPNWDEIIVLVNDPVYGGAGGSISVTTTNPSARLIVVHEYGHTFHRLADEYTTAYPGFPACSDLAVGAHCEANVTDAVDASQIKWASWITPGNAVPTPAGSAGVGLFAGARYQSSGMYRPANTCAMRNMGAQFCPVCSQEYVLRLYRGGWGSPAAGIDLIEPGSESPSAASTVSYAPGSTQVFSASVLRPEPNGVTLQWYVDGVAVPGANAPSFAFQQATATPASREIELRATDATALVRAQMAGADLVHRRTWRVNVSGGSLPTLSLGDASVSEGDTGTRSVDIPVTLSAPASAGGASVMLATVDDSARSPADFVARSAAVQIPGGQSSAVFRVDVHGDTAPEGDERFRVVASAPVGASIADGEAWVGITDDDGVLPAFATRADRFVLGPAAAGRLALDVLANDVLVRARMAGGRLAVVLQPSRGSVSVTDGGTPQDPSDDALVYDDGGAGAAGVADVLRYRLCEGGGRCSEADVHVLRRPVDEARLALQVDADRGHRDLRLEGLAAMPAAQFEAHGLVAPVIAVATLAVDPSPENPFDPTGASTTLRLLPQAVPAQATRWRVLIDASSHDGGDVDVYVGIDANRDRVADASEVACAAAMSTLAERCELAITQPAGEQVMYWVRLHNRSGTAQRARAELFEVPITGGSAPQGLAATGPGVAAVNEATPLRLVWNDPAFGVLETRGGWLELKSDADTSLGWVPVKLQRGLGPARPYALADGVPASYFVNGGAANEQLFIDVPAGATALTVDAAIRLGESVGSAANLYLARADAPTPSPGVPLIATAPPRAAAAAWSAIPYSGATGTLRVDAPQAGRWYITPVNVGGGPLRLELRASVSGTGPRLRPGGYFNPTRGGSGLFLYPAGTEWAGLWYTFLQDGTATWYYLQNTAPGANGIWRGTIYRSAWNGASNRLVPVGEARVTPVSTSAFTFSYTLDGETGSEAYESFGGGCPIVDGAPLDVSGHWFDPRRSGSGYSVQLFPDYEFYAVFGYDARGVPRYLVAERNGIGGATDTLALEQNTGACPLCVRESAPVRRTVGSLSRIFGARTLQRVQLGATYAAGVPGAWSADDAVIPLGLRQGCATN